MSAISAVDSVKPSPFKLLNRSGPIRVGGESSQAQPAPGIELGFICSLLIHHSIQLHCTQTKHILSWCFWNLIFTQTYWQKGQKNAPPSKSFHLKCSRKCLIEPCMHLDSSLIHLCIFSERQTAESFWYQVHFWASPCPCLSDREVEWRIKRQIRGYSSISSGVCLNVCVLVLRLFASSKGVQ